MLKTSIKKSVMHKGHLLIGMMVLKNKIDFSGLDIQLITVE